MPTSSSFVNRSFCLWVLFFCAYAPGLGAGPLVGAYTEVSVADREVGAAARFAVEAQTKKVRESAAHARDTLELVEIVEAQQQVVAGMSYRLKLKVKENGEPKTVEAVVWWQAWRKPDPYFLTSWQ